MEEHFDDIADIQHPEEGDSDSLPPKTLPRDSFTTTKLSGMYQDWFLDYASYVILERAVPEMRDGLKPVQRRILHSMKEMDDGRYNKVANIIGHTMKYHPHGDASIGDALVQLGQKDLIIDTQGNWGNILTGDSAAAPRYIEARPSKFALDVLFNHKTTRWKPSYDGRNKEPVTLPVKFPLLLAQGVEGIAVGLASKILPHNFVELIDAAILYFQGEEPNILPDFPTGGLADFSKYNAGLRGGKVRIRARISMLDKKTLVISEIPFGTTTGSLIDSIVAANEKGKIKIRKIEDNTAQNVEIQVHLMPGISPDQTIDALYAFSDCEISISPNSCIIDHDRPRFLDVNQLLKISADNTIDLLRSELEIEKHELLEQLLFSSLEKIFIEKRIYRQIEECETWEAVIDTIDKGLEPYKKLFYREIIRDDIVRLTEIKIKRISRYDAFKADELMRELESKLAKVNEHLANLVQYAIDYFTRIREKYGKGRERKTEIRFFDTIEATRVAVANEKLYVNRSEGFAGTGMKKDEYVCDCSDIDDIIVFREDGTFLVTRVSEKSFVGKDIIHIGVFERNNDRTIYNMVYQDGSKGASFMKRFAVKGITRDKEYNLTRGTKGSKVLYFTANPNGEAEMVTVFLRHKPKLKKPVFDLDFAELSIKGRAATGNLVTKHPVRKVVLKGLGVSTLGAIDIWFDDSVLRLNTDKRGFFVGDFKGDDKILAVFQNGTYRIMGFELGSHFDEKPLLIRKMKEGLALSAIFFDAEQGCQYLKRFEPEPNGKATQFIGEHPGNKLILITDEPWPRLQVNLAATARKPESSTEIDVESFIAVKSYKARGKRLSSIDIVSVEWLEPQRREEPESIGLPEEEEQKEQVVENIFEWLVTPEADIDVQLHDEDESTQSQLKKPLIRKSPKPESQIKPGDREKQIRLDLDV
ncbi:MAG TPA: DNA gyrase/topoisomerase IV subunit A [Bacteroidales bacterium]|nr:DNA gyrase/topoisomerase IV subunit A [Bacteroidales bacterium]